MMKYENFVNIPRILLQCDSLSGMIPDRLSHYFGEARNILLTFPPVEAVNFGSIFRRIEETGGPVSLYVV